MINYDKAKIKETLTIEDLFDLVHSWGGEPRYTDFGFVSATICHNFPGEGSHKLYYYSNSGLFICYTGGCAEGRFDIFELLRKVAKIQWNEELDLNAAIRWIAHKFSIQGTELEDERDETIDWAILSNYDRIEEIKNSQEQTGEIILKEYDDSILNYMNYNVCITPWIQDHIGPEAMKIARIGYYPGGEQITIPHFDKNNRFIGLRGRALIKENADLYGKYRPIRINQLTYNHPLGMNLYNLNLSKNNISAFKKAIIFESEKSCLQYKTYFGNEADISVACCGSKISTYQIQLLLDAGVEEIIIALDRQFQEPGDDEFKRWTKGLEKMNQKYHNLVNLSFIFDSHMITPYKASPTDVNKETFIQLFKERVML